MSEGDRHLSLASAPIRNHDVEAIVADVKSELQIIGGALLLLLCFFGWLLLDAKDNK